MTITTTTTEHRSAMQMKEFSVKNEVRPDAITINEDLNDSPEARGLFRKFMDSLLEVTDASNSGYIIKQITHVIDWIQNAIPVWQIATQMETPDQLMQFQKDNIDACFQLASALEGEGIKRRCEEREFQDLTKKQILDIQPDWRYTSVTDEVKIKLAAGGTATLNDIRYCSPKSAAKKGEKKKGPPKKKRDLAGSGCYPSLESLGIIEHVTPFLASEVALEVTEGPSIEAAQENLARRNIIMTPDEVRTIAERFGNDALALRLEWVESGQMPKGMEFKTAGGRILFIGFDGFMLQLQQKKKGRIAKDKKQHGWYRHWTETKSFVIREIDEEGRQIPGGLSIIDGTLGTADDMFSLLEVYLFDAGIDLDQYDYIVLGADGADWIRPRAKALAAKLPVAEEKIKMFVDWYHAKQHLWKVAKARKGWKRKDREKWVKKVKTLLYTGNIDGVIAEIDKLRVGRNAKTINRCKGYFIKNADRMQYSELKELGLPIGSGVVESAGRQTINLRLKGSGMSWLPINGEGMVMLRSYLKSGNWDMLSSMVMNFRARRFDRYRSTCHKTITEVRKSVVVQVPVHPKSKKRNTGICSRLAARGAVGAVLQNPC